MPIHERDTHLALFDSTGGLASILDLPVGGYRIDDPRSPYVFLPTELAEWGRQQLADHRDLVSVVPFSAPLPAVYHGWKDRPYSVTTDRRHHALVSVEYITTVLVDLSNFDSIPFLANSVTNVEFSPVDLVATLAYDTREFGKYGVHALPNTLVEESDWFNLGTSDEDRIWPMRFSVDGERLFCRGPGSEHVVVRNPRTGEAQQLDHLANRVTFSRDGSHFIEWNREGGTLELSLYDVKDPLAPQKLWKIATPGAPAALISPSGHLVLVKEDDRVLVIDKRGNVSAHSVQLRSPVDAVTFLMDDLILDGDHLTTEDPQIRISTLHELVGP
jgi:hypothetical protein